MKPKKWLARGVFIAVVAALMTGCGGGSSQFNDNDASAERKRIRECHGRTVAKRRVLPSRHHGHDGVGRNESAGLDA